MVEHHWDVQTKVRTQPRGDLRGDRGTEERCACGTILSRHNPYTRCATCQTLKLEHERTHDRAPLERLKAREVAGAWGRREDYPSAEWWLATVSERLDELAAIYRLPAFVPESAPWPLYRDTMTIEEAGT